MKRNILVIWVTMISITLSSQEKEVPFKSGEWLRYRMSYSGFLKAGTADLSLNEVTFEGKKVLHATGKGRTSNVVGWFFKVEDLYESFFDTETTQPYLFKRKIDEGGYRKHKHVKFDYTKNKASVTDLINKTETEVSITEVQDMISAFYYLRQYDTKAMQKGEEISINMFFDNKSHPFKLRYLGSEILNTKFGKVKTQKFRPLVQAGRVFKAQESVTVWITADDNKIPVKMKASLSVGSLRAELEAYKGLANSFELIFD